MKALRLLVLLLLAALLPLRGAMATAMLCPVAGTQDRTVAAAGKADAHAMGHCDAQAAPASDTCPLCSALCSLPVLPSETLRLAEPPALCGTAFAEVSTPAATFLSGGQDRPPKRT